jgi:hypothetical protein
MAHYLAELLSSARSGDALSRNRASADAAKLIVQLWKHRENLPETSHPFREYKSVCEVLHSLDLSANSARYFHLGRSADREEDKPSSTEPWLTAMKAIDRSARLLIQFCIQRATQEVAETGEKWIQAAELANMPDDRVVLAIRTIVRARDVPSSQDEVSLQIEKIERSLAALKWLGEISDTVKTEFEMLRASLAVKKEGSNSRKSGKPSRMAGKSSLGTGGLN